MRQNRKTQQVNYNKNRYEIISQKPNILGDLKLLVEDNILLYVICRFHCSFVTKYMMTNRVVLTETQTSHFNIKCICCHLVCN